ncbi:RES family NAD+ phosphorylase [Coraliomargarita sp. SDUM461004]|uniref:RES family NAD+ phosphorylase n=1 Tax=Thalassobacterium sedimentorum TaxID=3041258 RepID=A0ABU1AIT3_9BACT|nr:RES family NAD+ phosphorylase [Coraliomargarita sp. SDUM461004]MDQ8194732.1 RES family NAD+ phosphorylase [Coraliomargarita sp. SDUM461004]
MPIPLKPHPTYKRLLAELKREGEKLKSRWEAPVYRCVELKWARPKYLISGEGTRQRGSRWMRPNNSRVMHAASTETLALKESRQAYDYYGIHKPRQNPRVSVELLVELQQVIDLRKLREILDSPTIEELLGEDWEKLNSSGVETLAQTVGRAIHDLGYEGLIAPSAKDRRGRNLIWFPDQLLSESRISISGEKQLEQWLA